MEFYKYEVWITKYALTKGIQHCYKGGTISENGYFYPDNGYYGIPPNEWFKEFQDAEKKAESKRLKKIENLKKQIKKLEKMEFKDERI